MAADRLGKLIITVFRDGEGFLNAELETELSPALCEMQGALSAEERAKAVSLRRKACQAACQFFSFVRDPDSDDEVI